MNTKNLRITMFIIWSVGFLAELATSWQPEMRWLLILLVNLWGITHIICCTIEGQREKKIYTENKRQTPISSKPKGSINPENVGKNQGINTSKPTKY